MKVPFLDFVKPYEELKTELYAEIGKLKVELEWLQKKSGLSR